MTESKFPRGRERVGDSLLMNVAEDDERVSGLFGGSGMMPVEREYREPRGRHVAPPAPLWVGRPITQQQQQQQQQRGDGDKSVLRASAPKGDGGSRGRDVDVSTGHAVPLSQVITVKPTEHRNVASGLIPPSASGMRASTGRRGGRGGGGGGGGTSFSRGHYDAGYSAYYQRGRVEEDPIVDDLSGYNGLETTMILDDRTAVNLMKSGPLGACNNPLCPHCPPVTQILGTTGVAGGTGAVGGGGRSHSVRFSGVLRQRPGKPIVSSSLPFDGTPSPAMSSEQTRLQAMSDGSLQVMESPFYGNMSPGASEGGDGDGWRPPPPREKHGLRGRMRRFAELLSLDRIAGLRRYSDHVINPHSLFMRRWNIIMVAACTIALFVDPCFLFSLWINPDNMCVDLDCPWRAALTVVRSITDFIYLCHILLQFRICYFAPSQFGPGELVSDVRSIAVRYCKKKYGGFVHDVSGVLPLPQLTFWFLVHKTKKRPQVVESAKTFMQTALLLQYIPRMARFLPLIFALQTESGFLSESSYFVPVVYIICYSLFGHVFGSLFYFFGLLHVNECMKNICKCESYTSTDALARAAEQRCPSNVTFARGVEQLCHDKYLDCGFVDITTNRRAWFNSSAIKKHCLNENSGFDYGIYIRVLKVISHQNIIKKYIYCLLWGLQQLASLADNLSPSDDGWDSLFAILIICSGMLMFGVLISNIQNFISSLLRRSNDMQIRRRDLERWMNHRRLPNWLRIKIRQFEHQKWIVNQGVDEEVLLKDLSHDLRRSVKLHLCFELVRAVPLFDWLNDHRVLVGICERLQQRLFGSESVIIDEGEPVLRMYFIIRGRIKSTITMNQRTGYLNEEVLGPNNFFGDELLAWCLLGCTPGEKTAAKSDQLQQHAGTSQEGGGGGGGGMGRSPIASQTITSITVVDAFSLELEDLQFVCDHFPQLRTRKMKRYVKYFSTSWRLWAALKIQGGWKAYKRRKSATYILDDGSYQAGPSKIFP